jgi:hypothetical protein
MTVFTLPEWLQNVYESCASILLISHTGMNIIIKANKTTKWNMLSHSEMP